MKPITTNDIAELRRQMDYARTRGLDFKLIRPKKALDHHRTQRQGLAHPISRSQRKSRSHAHWSVSPTAQKVDALVSLFGQSGSEQQPLLVLTLIDLPTSSRIWPDDWNEDLHQYLASRPQAHQALTVTEPHSAFQPITLVSIDLI